MLVYRTLGHLTLTLLCRDSVAPLAGDPLHSLLSSLGPPSLCSLLGAAEDSDCDSSLASLGKTEVCLTLSPAAGSSSPSSSDTDKLWVKTKHLLLAVLPAVFAHGETHRTLIGSLKSRTTPDQETEYCAILDRRDTATGQADSHAGLDMTNVFCDEEGQLPLEDAK